MGKACKLYPDSGLQLFNESKKKYGAKTAWDIHKVVTYDKLADLWDSLSKDSEGFPLLSELIKNPVMQYAIGDSALLGYEESKFFAMDFTLENYNYMLDLAYEYNNNPENSPFVAIVMEDKNGKIKMSVRKRNNQSVEEFNNQYSANKLNNKLSNIFSPLGVTVGMLTEEETRAGRVGITEFGAAKSMANSFSNMIRIANNIEGNFALSEEFSHLLVGIFREEPLILRALNSINNEETLRAILGDEYDELMLFYNGDLELIAEEALGQLLKKNLLSLESDGINSTLQALLSRATNITKRNFKDYDATEVDKAIIEADNTMSELAKNILGGVIEVTLEQIEKANKRTVRFNALSDRIAHNIEILKEAKNTELKRYKITTYYSNQAKEKQKNLINSIDRFTDEDADTVIGLLQYSQSALDTLLYLYGRLDDINSMSPKELFRLLRKVRSYIQSYASFIKSMYDELNKAKDDTDAAGIYDNIEIDDRTISLGDIIKDLNHLSSLLTGRYEDLSVSLFGEFIKPFFGEEALIAYNRKKGTNKTIEDILRTADIDISLSDRWLDSMADSSDILLLLFDKAVKNSKDKIRLKTIDDINEIQALRIEAESKGITDFSWLFELDDEGNLTGNYIGEINYGMFDKAREKMEKSLERRYGKNASGENARLKAEERAQWYRDNTVGDSRLPNSKYKNTVYQNLTSVQRDFRNKFLALKSKFDGLYPQNRVDLLKAIQMRKSSGNRFLQSLGKPSTIFENIKESIKSAFLDSEDDDTMFGEKTTRGMTNFDGTEFMLLPVLYTNRLKNPNELSTDVFASLMSYAYSSNTYDEMNKIIDPLEVGRSIITDKVRKTEKERGGKKVKEVINVLGQKVINKVIISDSLAQQKLDDFFESQIYQRYLKDQGTVGKINVNKATSWLLKANSLAQLGFNWLANTANVATGIGMCNIEAACGQFFGVSELASADAEYTSLLIDFMSELGARNKTNKLSLFDQLFDIRLNFSSKVKHNLKKNLLLKIFGENIAYLGQDSGDHWLYNRVAIAMCKRMKVLVPKVNNIRKKVRGLLGAQEVVEKIIRDSNSLNLTADEKYYLDPSGTKHIRVTSAIQSEGEENRFSATHEDGSPNNWILPSTNIGTGFDEMTRDFFDNKITYEDSKWTVSGRPLLEVYPNTIEDDLQEFAAQLADLKQSLEDRGLTVIPRDVKVNGYATVNVGGKLRQIPVAGTLDLLAYDKNGDFYIFDMKTHRGNISMLKRNKWSSQLSLYKKFLEDKYGINIKSTNIIPISVKYPTPIGEQTREGLGEAEYTVVEGTNQLLIDGEEFKEASPELEDIIDVRTRNIVLDYNSLDEESLLMVTDDRRNINTNDYNEMSLWDALLVVDAFSDNSLVKKLTVPEGTLMANIYGDENSWEDINIGAISRRIAKVNQSLYGIYNDDDANAANRIALGRIMQQYRKWMKPLFNKRFLKAQEDVILGITNEGYYRTVLRIANELRRGELLIGSMWNSLNEEEKANVVRATAELLLLLAVFLLVRLVDWPDDKDRPWAVKYAEYMAQRELHELGGLAPTPIMFKELSKTITSPFPVMSTVNSLRLATFSLIDPEDYSHEIQSGPYKGMNNVLKYWLKAPIPFISQYRQIDKFMHELDTSLLYYTRPY